VLRDPANTRQQPGNTQAQNDGEQHPNVKTSIHATNLTLKMDNVAETISQPRRANSSREE